MIFPYPPGILQGDQIWAHLRRENRLAFRHHGRTANVTRVGDIAILTYRASAEKPHVPVFKALCASTYLDDDDMAKALPPANDCDMTCRRSAASPRFGRLPGGCRLAITAP
jgi:adenylylsulfate kinase-like enzyme